MKHQMPSVPVAGLSDEAKRYAVAISNKGKLRASKPPIEYRIEVRDGRKIREPVVGGGEAYVWRMVAFSISPISSHHCMPRTADFDIPGMFDERRFEAKRLDAIVDEIVKAVPKSERHGILRWGRAYGLI
jgi:hypothetical protein